MPMDRARIPVDFNELDTPMPISKTACVTDSDGNSFTLTEGMEIYIYEIDYDEFERQDNLIADGIAVRNPNENSVAKWCCKINELGIRHESDDPNFPLPQLSADEKRSITYSKIEKWLDLMGKKPNVIVKGAIETYVNILRRIDRNEL